MNTPCASPLWTTLRRMAERLNYHWGRMGRAYNYDNGYGNPWYGRSGEETLPKDTMIYACDAKLGNP